MTRKTFAEAREAARLARIEHNEKALIKRERKALKKAAGSPQVYLQTLGKRDMMDFTARGWEIAGEINSLRGGVSTQPMVKIDRELLEARLG